MKKNIVAIIMCVFVISLATIACGSSSAPVVTTGEPAATKDEIVTQPTQSPLGSTRDNPAPFGTSVTIEDMTFTVLDIIRPADSIVSQGNMFNSTPVPGQEYMMVEIKVTCQKNSNEKCQLYSGNLKIIGSSGNVSETEFVAGVEGGLDMMPEFFGGASVQGKNVYIVTQGDNGLVLEYDPFLGNPMYLSLSK